MGDTRAREAAALIWENWCNQSRVKALPEYCRPRTVAEGYAAQAELSELSGWQAVGWKIAATSTAGQKHIGVDGPLAGRLLDGTQRDSSFERGEPATFPLGRVVKAGQRAIPEMGAGDTIELYAPADLAYGPVGKGPIPGNATLVFKVELIGIE